MADPPKPPPSPLSDELVDLDDIDDGPSELPEPAFGEVSEMIGASSDVGNDDDRDHAVTEAERNFKTYDTLAKAHYQAEVDATGGSWPGWEELGEYEHAAWRFYVCNGGAKPKLTKTARPIGHAMGQAQT